MALILSGDTGVPASGMPTGSVIQVVQATYATQTAYSSTTFTNTGLSVSITPISTTNKILIYTNLMGVYTNTTSNFLKQRITRNGTSIVDFDHIAGYSSQSASSGSNTAFVYLDSPATISSISYVLQASSTSGAGINWCNDGVTSTITVMEIKA